VLIKPAIAILGLQIIAGIDIAVEGHPVDTDDEGLGERSGGSDAHPVPPNKITGRTVSTPDNLQTQTTCS
jgi:hypothetical protein